MQDIIFLERIDFRLIYLAIGLPHQGPIRTVLRIGYGHLKGILVW
jgi:hypothetical protein